MLTRRTLLGASSLALLVGCTDPGDPLPDPTSSTSEAAGDVCLSGLPAAVGAGIPQMSGGANPSPVALSPDGSRLASATVIDGSVGIHVWDTASGQITHRFSDHVVRGTPLWDSTGRLVHLMHNAAVIIDLDEDVVSHIVLGHAEVEVEDSGTLTANHLTIAPGSDEVASLGEDGTLRLFDVVGCSSGPVLEVGNRASQAVLTGSHLLVDSGDGVRVLAPDSGDVVATLADGSSRAPMIASPDATFVLVGTPGTERITAFSTSDWQPVRGFRDNHAFQLAISPDGSLFASFGTQPHVVLHRVVDGSSERHDLPSATGGVVLSADGRMFTSHAVEGILEWALGSTTPPVGFQRP